MEEKDISSINQNQPNIIQFLTSPSLSASTLEIVEEIQISNPRSFYQHHHLSFVT
jgi:hypothetical protein